LQQELSIRWQRVEEFQSGLVLHLLLQLHPQLELGLAISHSSELGLFTILEDERQHGSSGSSDEASVAVGYRIPEAVSCNLQLHALNIA
jgi:hypothetical protein